MVLVLVAFSLVTIMIFAAFAIDRSFMTYQRVNSQDAADMAARACGWTLAGYYTSTPSTAEKNAAIAIADTIANDNGYPTSDVTVTYPYLSNSSWVNVEIKSTVPLFFGGIIGHRNADIEARATDSFEANQPEGYNQSEFGILENDFNYAAYGPDNAADRGDKVNTGYNTIGSYPNGLTDNLWFGKNSFTSAYTGLPNENGGTDYPFGSVYKFAVPGAYAQTSGSSNLDFEIFDPDTYAKSNDPLGNYDEMNKAPAGSPGSGNEDWLYTLWNGPPGAPGSQIISQYVYGENLTSNSPLGTNDQPNTNDHWVTPPGFNYNASNDLNTVGSAGTLNYYISVQTTDGVTVPTYDGNGTYSTGNPSHYGTGYDENGYLLRVGAPHPADNVSSITSTASQTLTDSKTSTGATRQDLMDPDGIVPGSNPAITYNTYWHQKYSVNNIVMTVPTPESINANESSGTATVPIYFGYGPANPQVGGTTTITFYGWDEDSGATTVEYKCYSQANEQGSVLYDFGPAAPPFGTGGVIGGNGAWGGVGQLGDIYPIVNYTAGYWVGYYTTGPGDNTTWFWNDNYGQTPSRTESLISTGNNVY